MFITVLLIPTWRKGLSCAILCLAWQLMFLFTYLGVWLVKFNDHDRNMMKLAGNDFFGNIIVKGTMSLVAYTFFKKNDQFSQGDSKCM